MFRKIENGWMLAKQCWRVLLLDKELLVFPAFSMVACILVLASFAVPMFQSGALERMADDPSSISQPIMFVAYAGFYFATYFVIIFFNSALIACALIRFRGGDPTVADGLRAASARLPKIIAWAAVSAFVGVILQAIEQRSGMLGKIVVGLLGAGWAIASYFAIPVLVTENTGPVDALKRSASIMRKAWGEALTAEFGMGILIFLAILPVIFIIGLGGTLFASAPAVGALLIVAGVAWFILVVLAGATLDAILKAALYLYASDGHVPQNFDNDAARVAFAPKR